MSPHEENCIRDANPEGGGAGIEVAAPALASVVDASPAEFSIVVPPLESAELDE